MDISVARLFVDASKRYLVFVVHILNLPLVTNRRRRHPSRTTTDWKGRERGIKWEADAQVRACTYFARLLPNNYPP